MTLDNIMQHHPMSNAEHIVRDIHDILESYYKVARKRFVDVICMHCANYNLVSAKETPLNLFSPTFVNNMSAEKLAEIAGEDPQTKRKRAMLMKEIQDLEAGRKILL